MKEFIGENFLLNNETAENLYHNYANNMPIFDYHCHLNPKDISDDKRFKNITELWLGGDHYKWRAMRSNGINEKYITGNASDYDKFKAWAKTVPYCVGNPLYHWSHLELKRYFGLDIIINEDTADEIWEKTNTLLQEKEFSTKSLIKKFNVKVLCTTDDAIDTLEYHQKIREDKSFDVKVLPTLRPDKGINIENIDFLEWINKLSEISEIPILTYDDFMNAMKKRVVFFHKEGCRLSDHGIDKMFFEEATDEEVSKIFQKAIDGQSLTDLEIDKYKTKTLENLAKMYNELGWVMQLHIGALRNNNTRMYNKLGADIGYDSVGDEKIAYALSRFLDKLDSTNQLTKTILYCANPQDNDVLGTMIGNFQGDEIPGKIQMGAAWWFNDQKYGIKRQLISLSNLGLLRRSVGMVTDSRSFLSYPRHEYYRRVLCNIVGTWAEEGEVSNDIELLGSMVKEICYMNAINYIKI